MIAYRILSADDFIPLYECFLRAFADYEVDMRMSREQFEQRLVRDGVRLEMSVAAFDDERMIGFCINGIGSWQGKQTAYDAGTGVVPGYRGQGIGKELFAFTVPRLKDRGISQYLLEVLSSNAPAVALYRKLEFKDTRQLAVFRSDKPIHSAQEASIRRVERANWDLYRSFWDGHPSWQNSIDAVERIAGDRSMIGAYVDGECVGYGVAFRPSASLMQLAVAPAHRRKGFGSAILSAVQAEVSSTESLKVNNIDEELKGTLEFYRANGFDSVLSQFEMMKSL
jgi:ribosomal protein S18 acetylase RimI-like enzyme